MALDGNRPIATNKASLSGWIWSSGRHVSTTNRKTGGRLAVRGSRYSMVEKLGISSAGRLVSLRAA